MDVLFQDPNAPPANLGGDNPREPPMPLPSRCFIAILLAVASPFAAHADVNSNTESDAPPLVQRQARSSTPVYKRTLRPYWFAGGSKFWYRNDLAEGRREYFLVDAEKGRRKPAFDHKRLAKSLGEQGVKGVRADRLSLDQLEFAADLSSMSFRIGGQRWTCKLEGYSLEKMPERAESETSGDPTKTLLSRPGGDEMHMLLVNETGRAVTVSWRDARGRRVSYGRIRVGQDHEQHTFDGHAWEVHDAESGARILTFRADKKQTRVVLRKNSAETKPASGEARRRPRTRPSAPQRKWDVETKDYNLVLQAREGDEEIQLTKDGVKDHYYTFANWSPNGRYLVASRLKPGDRKEVHLVRSSPKNGGRAQLESRPYPLPGDRFNAYELHIFDTESKKHTKADVEPIDFGFPRIRWSEDSKTFTYEKTDRGHQRFRVIEVNVEDGSSRNLIDEKAKTFIWTAHGPSLRRVTYLYDTKEIIYISEKDGWRHLYLVDAKTGAFKNQITKGDWVVRGVDRIDRDKRQIWFRAGGVHPKQDPYQIHFCRVDFDGSNLVVLTEGDGTHSINYSPDRRFLIDTYSRVDMPPVHELRRVEDGKLVCSLERAEAPGWRGPKVFTAKGRDGKTDIWGFIAFPKDFDETRKYPVIESIYAGPHDSHVPKSFSPGPRYRSLTDLGFIVVKIDGMGTANRSKAFHDVCWKNLKDAGLPDRILWIKAAAKQFPQMDIERVGIYGTSAGGQNAAGAVLFHGDFYKAAAASCGCHDNRMDKASWNEQWMGYPVDSHYAESSNIDNAHRLEGKLLLLVGEMDKNVPPESTLRFADALIRANKDFELLVLPNAGHTSGGAYGRRRIEQFFVRHLKPSDAESVEPVTAKPSLLAEVAQAQTETSDVARRIEQRYEADLAGLNRFYPIRLSAARQQRLSEFHAAWLSRLQEVRKKEADEKQISALNALIETVESRLESLQGDRNERLALATVVPFAEQIVSLYERRQNVEPIDSKAVAAQLSRMADQVREAQVSSAQVTDAALRKLAAKHVKELRDVSTRWFRFYDGYDPLFSWWVRKPHDELDKALLRFAAALDAPLKSTTAKASNPAPNGVPSVEDLLAPRQEVMPAVIRLYQADRQKVFPRRRRRLSTASEEQEGKQLAFYDKWKEKLGSLDYKEMSVDDQVDHVLLRRELEYRTERLKLRSSGDEQLAPTPPGPDNIRGYPVGRRRLLLDLRHAWIQESPEELIKIAEKELKWCRNELRKASQEMGFGDDWRKAIEKVKSMHVEPGKQPEMIRDLANEAIDYLQKHDLVTVPPLARQTWRMQMMTPERQRINPFFTGGEVISVSFPTDGMSHADKLQSMRGNNIPFARATVHHELIPGHHLQGFMNARYATHRRLFNTPFWLEGWALYWEMVLYARGFPQTPEDRVGFLVWRTHRCARIIFSLSFHLGRMKPEECVDFLVETVGFERNNAAAEVRRSVGRSYPPLYQAAYMIGGLQLRSLRGELVDSGKMSERDFHDAILKENAIPIALVRALLTRTDPESDKVSQWRFYE